MNAHQNEINGQVVNLISKLMEDMKLISDTAHLANVLLTAEIEMLKREIASLKIALEKRND